MGSVMRPAWLNKKINLRDCAEMRARIDDPGLNTVCEEALCPNIGECSKKGQATFLILGKYCTRQCAFCGVKRGIPPPVDPAEPARVAAGAARLGLNHIVITSVTRDDLADGGAQVFIDTIGSIRAMGRRVTIEILTPDFNFNKDVIRKVAFSSPDIFAHNIETVPRLYAKARKGADYGRSLSVLAYIKECDSSMPVKSGIMLGLGEMEEEVLGTINDIARTGCDFLSIGQYLAPGKNHLPVAEYLPPEKFDFYREKAYASGFRHVMSGPYVRSSYLSGEYLEKISKDPEKVDIIGRK
ncbi:MAG: lipoyl synthase [Candidatus Omnitrophica bacterium]|nr:lipoyl synthase [Candidatus Omnitrophota bacterium]